MTKTDMRMNNKLRRAAPVAAMAVGLLLSACSGWSNPEEDKLGTFLVAPGKYDLYDCQQMVGVAGYYVSREKQLREVMAKAEEAPAGGLISAVAYRSEYGQVRGNIADLRREVTKKKCDPPPPGLMPGSAAPAAAQPVVAPPPPKRRSGARR
ncbi:MAG: hypothetical protein WC670_02995 [Pseudolabrys sp.]|jgi:hypothetical protein